MELNNKSFTCEEKVAYPLLLQLAVKISLSHLFSNKNF